MKAEKLRLKFADYQQLDAVNVSSLLHLKRSPKHYRHYLEHGRADTDYLRRGRACHTAILEPEQFMREYVMWEGAVRRGKEWDAFETEARELGKTVIRPCDYDLAIAMRDAVREHDTAMHYLGQRGEREVTIVWEHEATGLKLKARLDWLCADAIVDIKSTSLVDAWSFGRNAASLGYHIRAAFYADAVHALLGEWRRSVLLCVESTAPHDVAVRTVPQPALDRGRILYEELLHKLVECRSADHWPGVAEDEEDLVLPPWVYGPGGEGLALEIGGESVAL